MSAARVYTARFLPDTLEEQVIKLHVQNGHLNLRELHNRVRKGTIRVSDELREAVLKTTDLAMVALHVPWEK